MRGTMPGARRRGRPCTAWMDNIKTWIGLTVEESVTMAEDRDKWRKCIQASTLGCKFVTADNTNLKRLNECW